MTVSWTPEQVLNLAPDESSRKNASGLASPRKWKGLFQQQNAALSVLWGEIQGSGSDPYRCQIDLSGPAAPAIDPKPAAGVFAWLLRH